MTGKPKVSSFPSILVLAVAASVGLLLARQKKYPWHEGPHWERFLEIYDNWVVRNYRSCDSRLIPTRFGPTQVHGCGDIANPAVLLLPGAASNSIMYSDWLIPALSEDHYAVAVDNLCDVGRSVPKDKRLSNCPQNQQELAEWVQEVVQGLGLSLHRVSLVGYSYGSFIAACTASFLPDLVDKLVLIAPAAVFAPIRISWFLRAIVCRLFPFFGVTNWFFKYMSADPDFDLKNMNQMDQEMREAINDADASALAVLPVQLSDERLHKITAKHSTLLVIGEDETVTSATVAVETARRTGVQVQLFPQSGHLLLMEHPREPSTCSGKVFLTLRYHGRGHRRCTLIHQPEDGGTRARNWYCSY